MTPPESNSDTDGEMEREQIDNTSLSDFVDVRLINRLLDDLLVLNVTVVYLKPN